MNDKLSTEKGPEFEEYPDLATESAIQDEHNASESDAALMPDSSLLSYADAMRILKYVNIPGERVTRYRTSRDSFLDYL
jgi:hypothetical protein